jgi:hypothetical protein
LSVAGLDISVNSGQPGANARVVLRGANLLEEMLSLCFIIDGIPVNGDNLEA